MTSLSRIAGAILLIMLCDLSVASTNGWQLLNISKYVSVSYPAAWVRDGVSTDRLQIRSSVGGAEGIGIKQGQAEITVMEAPDSAEKPMSQVITYYTQDTTVLLRRNVLVEATLHGCSNLKEVISREPAISPADSPIDVPRIVNTDLFCEGDGRKIVLLLRNWEGDKKQQEYQQVALRMAKNIRIAQHASGR